MVCPLVPVLGLGATVGGAHTVLVQDRPRRHVAWLVALALGAGWTAYATAFRTVPVRIALESVTMLALAAGGWRAWWLARHAGVRSPLVAHMAPTGRALWGWLASPAVLVANVWLVAMLTMEWRGKAHFAALEYALVSLVLAGAIAARMRSVARARRGARGMPALESFAGSETVAGCPLGFGDASARAPSAASGQADVTRG